MSTTETSAVLLKTPAAEARHPIFSMGLHEKYEIDDSLAVWRVPGGWIYRIDNTDDYAMCFVPDKGN